VAVPAPSFSVSCFSLSASDGLHLCDLLLLPHPIMNFSSVQSIRLPQGREHPCPGPRHHKGSYSSKNRRAHQNNRNARCPNADPDVQVETEEIRTVPIFLPSSPPFKPTL